MTRPAVGLLVLLLAAMATPLAAQTARQASQPAAAATQPVASPVQLEHISLDLARRRVTVDAAVCLRQGALEFLLCRSLSKEHESILATQARPADLHAALLALGLDPGKPAEQAGAGEDGKMLPPRGAELKITLAWRDADGRERTAQPADWILARSGGSAAILGRWIFVGSDVLPGGQYWADGEGGIVAVSNFASAVIDVPFLSSSDNDLLEFAAATDAIPPLGQSVQVVIEPLAGAESAADARATLEIDRAGRLRADGAVIELDELAGWAERYIARHSQGRVVVRLAGEALIWDLDRAARQLRMGGVRDVAEQRLAPANDPMPRTSEEALRAAADLRVRLAEGRDYVGDPRERGEATLKHVEQRIAELDALRRLWLDYAAGVRRALDEFSASTQPAAAEAGR